MLRRYESVFQVFAFRNALRFYGRVARMSLLPAVTSSLTHYLERSRPLLLFLGVAAWQISVPTSCMFARMFMLNYRALVHSILAVHHELARTW
jgi:hypothetical protein